MKNIIAIEIITTFLLSCNLLKDDLSPQFPECVGIKESLNPKNIINPYSAEISGKDTLIYTQFIFTDYIDYNYLITAERSFKMYVKFIRGTSIIYQGFSCYYSYSDKKWYAQSGYFYRGRNTTWDFHFETFDCSKISGTCNVIQANIQDTLIYHFEGSRKLFGYRIDI